jgi:AhpD family alkylhydroperoxidase
MEQRLDYSEIAPDGVEILRQLERYLKKTGLEPDLLELVKLRASQINGCAYCIDMHTKDARSRGESEQRLYGISAWREAPFYTGRERAALAWAEAVTRVNEDRVPDEIYDQVKQHFTEKELVDLTLAVIAINSWNRLAISFRTPVGSYKPDHPTSIKKSLKQAEPG